MLNSRFIPIDGPSSNRSTVAGKEIALKRFLPFVQMQYPQVLNNINVDNFKFNVHKNYLCNDLILNRKTFAEYANYLVNLQYVTDNTMNYYSLSTVYQYISGIYTLLIESFIDKKADFQDKEFFDKNTKWMEDIRNAVTSSICSRAIKQGERIITKSEPITREHMKYIIEVMLSEKDCTKNQRNIEMAAVFVWDYKCTGRSGEAALITRKCITWSTFFNCLQIEWSAKQKSVYTVPDIDSWLLDPFTLYAISLIIGNGTQFFK